MTRRLAVLLATLALSATMAGTAQARPVNEWQMPDHVTCTVHQVKVGYQCVPKSQAPRGPGRWAI